MDFKQIIVSTHIIFYRVYSLIWKIIKMQSFFKTHSDVIITALTKPEHLRVCNITNASVKLDFVFVFFNICPLVVLCCLILTFIYVNFSSCRFVFCLILTLSFCKFVLLSFCPLFDFVFVFLKICLLAILICLSIDLSIVLFVFCPLFVFVFLFTNLFFGCCSVLSRLLNVYVGYFLILALLAAHSPWRSILLRKQWI